MDFKKTLTRLYYGFFTIGGLVAALFGAILLFIGLPAVKVTSIETQMRVVSQFGLEIDQQLLPTVLTMRFFWAGLLYLLSGAMMYKPSRDKALDWWDSLTPEEPASSHDWTTFLIVEPNVAPTGFMLALLATAVLQGIPLL